VRYVGGKVRQDEGNSLAMKHYKQGAEASQEGNKQASQYDGSVESSQGVNMCDIVCEVNSVASSNRKWRVGSRHRGKEISSNILTMISQN
jgi:hypothetical protein